MKKYYFRLIAVILSLILAVSIFAVNTSATSSKIVPFENYTYWEGVSETGRKKVNNRAMYECAEVLTASEIGVADFEELIDVCVAKNGYVYLLDTKRGITVLDENYKLVKEISTVKGSQELSFIGAKSIYVDEKNYLYICDTENERVIKADDDGNFVEFYTLPVSSLIPENFDFKPIRVAVDTKGYIYILSEGSYYGALLYAPDKTFIGFYGANTVKNGIIGGIQSLFKRMFPNTAKSSNSERVLPFCFSDIVIDDEGFVYTATDRGDEGQIKKLSPGEGSNILDSDSVNFLDDEVNRTYNDGYALSQSVIGLAVSDNGFIYGLESSYGRIFVYDTNCKMITAFGGGMGIGTQQGTFRTPSAIDIKGSDVLVCDKTNNNLTIFRANDYGNKVIGLIDKTNNGYYQETKEGWIEVLSVDKNLQIAYTGLARAYLAEEKYHEAIEYAYKGYDRETYSLAFEYYRNEWLIENFSIVFLFALIIIAVFIVATIVVKKKNIVFIKNKKVALMLQTPIHPGKTFETIKDNDMGSFGCSVALILLFYISAVLKVLCGGYMFTIYDPATFNSLWVFVRSAGLIILWVVANWLVCTLMGGKGKLKEILVVSAYSLIPIIVERFVWILLSNFMLPSESAFLGILDSVAFIFTFIILCVGMLRIHDFTMTRFIGTGILTVLGIAAIIFLLILIGILLQQLGGFIVTILIEMFM